LQAVDSFGGFLRAYPLADVSRSGQVGMAVLPGGSIAACESEFSRVSIFSSDGKLLARLEDRGSNPGQVNGPSALAVDRAGRLYVADTQNHRVQVFRIVDRLAPRGH
jgi:DNA-binding beta-propeller fold protein YncE